MFGTLGFSEILLILGLALLIFGPRELPKIGRTIGKTLAEFRKASNDLRRSLNTELLEEELRANDPRKIVKDTMADLEAAATFDEPSGKSDLPDEKDESDLPDKTDSSDRPDTPETGTSESPAAVPATVARGSAPESS